jgi:hypothetical protein
MKIISLTTVPQGRILIAGFSACTLWLDPYFWMPKLYKYLLKLSIRRMRIQTYWYRRWELDYVKVLVYTDVLTQAYVLTAVGADRSSKGNRVPADAALVGPPQGGPTIWWRSREVAGWGQHRTDRRGELWGRPMSSSGRLMAEMMMKVYTYIHTTHALSPKG